MYIQERIARTHRYTHPLKTVHTFQWNVGSIGVLRQSVHVRMCVCMCVRVCLCVDAATTKIRISKDSLVVWITIYNLVVIQVATKRGTRGNLCVNEIKKNRITHTQSLILNLFKQREKNSNQFEFEHHSVHYFLKHNNKFLFVLILKHKIFFCLRGADK